jgi:hypothetical protein
MPPKKKTIFKETVMRNKMKRIILKKGVSSFCQGIRATFPSSEMSWNTIS